MWITKRQFRGAWFLGVLIVIVCVGLQLVNGYFSDKLLNKYIENDPVQLDSLISEIKLRQEGEKSFINNSIEARASFAKSETANLPLKLHAFDPNTISREEWIGMNLPEKVFNGLEKYRAKGGKIRKPEGVLKLYNLDPKIASQMVLFVKLDTSVFTKPRFEFKKNLPFPEKPKYKPFDLNTADTTQLMAVYGIGRGIANRLVRHRNGLGGFLSKNYVYDVFGIDSSVVDELFLKAYIPENPAIQKLNINAATEEDLAKNPYIRKGFARIIFKYRSQHGPFKKAEDLLGIKIIKPDLVEKLKPYLEY